MFLLTRFCISFIFSVLAVYADEAADDAIFLKWSKSLSAHFKSGFPNSDVPSIDPYNSAKSHVVSATLGTYENAKLGIEVSDYTIRGLGDREVVNASTSYVGIRVTSYVTYNEIILEGKYVVFDHNMTNPSKANVTGNFKYILAGKMFEEMSIFNGTRGQAATYQFIYHFVQHPDYRYYRNKNVTHQGTYTLSGVSPELEAFIRSEPVTKRVDELVFYMTFDSREMSRAREEICFYVWNAAENEKLIKWAQELNAPFKAGFPIANISSIDPFTLNDHYWMTTLGTYKNASLKIGVANYTIRGLGDRKVVNATTIYYDRRKTIALDSYVIYDDITIEGEYLIFDKNTTNPVITNVTGNFTYNLKEKMFFEQIKFIGTGEKAISTYEFVRHHVFHPNELKNEKVTYYQGTYTLEGLPAEIETFARSESATKNVDHLGFFVMFVCPNVTKAREAIDNYSWNALK